MVMIVIFLIFLYINNGIIFYYGFSGLKGFLKNDYNGMSVPIIEHYYLLVIWFVCFIIFLIINILFLKKLVKKNELEKIFNYTKIIKYSAIPFWVINFISYFGVMQFFVLIMWGMAILIIPIILFLSYLILLATSIYSINYIILAEKNKMITKTQCIINIILQLCFILDIINVLYLEINKKKKKNNEVRPNCI